MINKDKFRKLKKMKMMKLHSTADGKMAVDLPPAQEMMAPSPQEHPAAIRPLQEISNRALAPPKRMLPVVRTPDINQNPQKIQTRQWVSSDLAPIYQVLVEIREELKKLNAK